MARLAALIDVIAKLFHLEDRLLGAAFRLDRHLGFSYLADDVMVIAALENLGDTTFDAAGAESMKGVPLAPE